MAGRQIRTISLSYELDQFIAGKVASGLYATASEVLRAGLRQLAAHEALLLTVNPVADVTERQPRAHA